MNIYLITNKITQEQYVGQTKLDIYERWGRHITDAYRGARGKSISYSYFHQKIVEYNPLNFDIKLLEECDEKQADIRERWWINFYNTYNCGYNSTIGGQDIFKIQEKGFSKGNKIGGKVVIQYDKNGVEIQRFDTAVDAAKSVNVTPANIRRVCNLLGKTCAGYQWRWLGDESPGPLKLKKEKEKKIPDTQKPVIQMNKKGDFIKEWISASEAAKTLELNLTCIVNCCNQKQKTSGGFLWKYKI